MTNLAFIKGEYGEATDFTFSESDLSGYTAATLTIKAKNGDAVKTITCSVPSSALVRWTMTSGDTDMAAGAYDGQLEITGPSKVKKVYVFPVRVWESLT